MHSKQTAKALSLKKNVCLNQSRSDVLNLAQSFKTGNLVGDIPLRRVSGG